MSNKSHKWHAENNPTWVTTITSEELKEALSGEIDRKLNAQLVEEERAERERAQKDHNDWYGVY
jgi:hypothetical protein